MVEQWPNIMYHGADVTAVDHAPRRDASWCALTQEPCFVVFPRSQSIGMLLGTLHVEIPFAISMFFLVGIDSFLRSYLTIRMADCSLRRYYAYFFIIWIVLSQYVVLNLFTGIIVDNFNETKASFMSASPLVSVFAPLLLCVS